MSVTNGTRLQLRSEDLARALEVVAEALHAPEATIRFRAATLYLTAARTGWEVAAQTNGAGHGSAQAAPLNGANVTAASPRHPAPDHPWRQQPRARRRAEADATTATSGFARGGHWPRPSEESDGDDAIERV